MSQSIRAATRTSGINGRTAREQRNSWGWSAVLPQRAEHGVGIVPVASAVEVAGAIAAQVVAIRDHTSVAVSHRVIRDDAVLDRRGSVEVGDAAATDCALRNAMGQRDYISADGAAADRQRALVVYAATLGLAKKLSSFSAAI